MDGDLIGVRPHRFTVDDYYRIVEAGLLPKGSRVELIRGQIGQARHRLTASWYGHSPDPVDGPSLGGTRAGIGAKLGSAGYGVGA